jgi:hypothetical protein
MINTLIRKDLRLLKQYVVGAIAVTIVCYIATAIGVIWLTDYQDESLQSLPVRIFLILRGGHNLGFGATAFLSVMIAGSIFTLERADRSAEFLACLPPRRYQHLISKFAVLFGTTAFMVIVHVTTTLVSDLLLPYVRATSYPFTEGTQFSSVLMFIGIAMSMIGGALAVSAWQSSNGFPILCGLLTPLALAALIKVVGYLLDLPMLGDDQGNRFIVTAMLVGIFLTFCGAYWYVERDEP